MCLNSSFYRFSNTLRWRHRSEWHCLTSIRNSSLLCNLIVVGLEPIEVLNWLTGHLHVSMLLRMEINVFTKPSHLQLLNLTLSYWYFRHLSLPRRFAPVLVLSYFRGEFLVSRYQVPTVWKSSATVSISELLKETVKFIHVKTFWIYLFTLCSHACKILIEII